MGLEEQKQLEDRSEGMGIPWNCVYVCVCVEKFRVAVVINQWDASGWETSPKVLI
jgi:hypothetical protein